MLLGRQEMESDVGSSPARRSRFELWVKGISLCVILLSLFVLMRALPLERWLAEFQAALKRLGYWGPLIYGLLYAVAVVLLIPGSLLTLAGGAVFGLVKGTLVVSLAATTGAALAFLIARHFAREKVQKRIRQSPRLQAVDHAIGREGWKIVALLRLSPAVPFTLQNYLYGVTAIRFWPCILTSWVAMLPGTFLYVYLGSLGSQALAGDKTTIGEWTLRGAGLLATVLVTVYIARIAKQAIGESVPISEENDAAKSQGNSRDASPPFPWKGTLLWIFAALLAVGLATIAHWRRDALP
jgi:uncharacterized membrane protein YdjX (TVP38/TMEM64 family)